MDRVITAPHEQLAACYRSCLPLTLDHELGSIMFSCISTGEFHFPTKRRRKWPSKRSAMFCAVPRTYL
ncbi:macro domain-containing protein [Actinobaculum sp. 313]|uniref:macro domain-containing protein n=1 Tax=Actinobaculum sp. 313 TaxID=2495645 RepID=UPI00196AF9FE|nr:macro domain-containing protein [Actinobaculum sp. 313]